LLGASQLLWLLLLLLGGTLFGLAAAVAADGALAQLLLLLLMVHQLFLSLMASNSFCTCIKQHKAAWREFSWAQVRAMHTARVIHFCSKQPTRQVQHPMHPMPCTIVWPPPPATPTGHCSAAASLQKGLAVDEQCAVPVSFNSCHRHSQT
jgi:hypothetical protein